MFQINHDTIVCYGPGGKALGYGLDTLGSIPVIGGVEIFLHSFVSRQLLRSTQPTTEMNTGEFPPGKGGRA